MDLLFFIMLYFVHPFCGRISSWELSWWEGVANSFRWIDRRKLVANNCFNGHEIILWQPHKNHTFLYVLVLKCIYIYKIKQLLNFENDPASSFCTITPLKDLFFDSSRGIEPRVLWDKGWLRASSVAFCKGNFVREAFPWTFQITLCLSEMFQNGYFFNAFISRVQYQMFIETIGYSASPCRSCVVFTGFSWYFCLGRGGGGWWN